MLNTLIKTLMLMNIFLNLFVPFPKILHYNPLIHLLCSRYAKGHDPGNWFVIDEETAEIKMIKQPDRESPFLVNGTYTAEILAISKGERDVINKASFLFISSHWGF